LSAFSFNWGAPDVFDRVGDLLELFFLCLC